MTAAGQDWPIIERWGLLEQIRRADRGCVLTGPAGVGKSATARMAAAVDAPPVVITGLEGLAAIPFGALQLAELTTPDGRAALPDDDAVTHLQSWLDHLISIDRPLIVDDPAHLDPDSSAVLADHIRRGNHVTITHRPDQLPPADLVAAIDDAGLPAFEITPFDPSMVGLAVELAVGCEPGPETTAQLASLSGGNPMLLREIVRDLTRRGAWVEVGGQLTVVADADPSARLGSLLDGRLPRDPDQLACLELVAHAGSITRTLANRVATEPGIRSLVTGGWLVGGDVLTIAHPLMHQFIVDRSDPVQLRRRRSGALDRIGPSGSLDATSRLQCLRWTFSLDRPISVDELRWGRSEASRRFDSDLACLIADRLAQTEPTVETTLELALVLAQAERYDEVVSVLRDGQRHATTRAEVIDIARFLLRFTGAIARLRRLGEPPEGLEIDVAAWADDRLGTTAFTDLLAALDLFAAGALDDACAKAAEVRAAGIEGLGDADEITMVASLYGGDQERAMAAFGRLEGQLGDPAYRHPKAVVIDAAASSLLMLEGRFEQAFAFDGTVAEVARVTNDHERAREMTGHRGMTALFIGRVDDSIDAFTRFRGYPSAPGSLRALYTAGLAQSLALAGRLGEAERVLTDVDRDADLVAPLMLPDFENMVAMTLVLLGRTDAGEERMRRALQFSSEYRVGRSELMALHGLARMDRIRPVDLERVADLPPRVTSGAPNFTRGVLELVEARRRQDPAALAAAGDTFSATDFGLGAAEAYAAACRAAPDRQSAEANRWLDALDDRLRRCPGLVGATVLVERSVDALTERERQIAALAAGAMANPDIAERLGLSVRTVENNLHRTFTKLAISTRTEIRGALLPDQRPVGTMTSAGRSGPGGDPVRGTAP